MFAGTSGREPPSLRHRPVNYPVKEKTMTARTRRNTTFVSVKTREAADMKRGVAKDGICEHCGGRIGRDTAVHPAGLVELATFCLLLILLSIVGYGVYRWIDHGGRKLFDHPSWHEPPDDWSL